MALSRRQRPASINIWPGFVDALTQLTMVIVFLLLIFTVGQFYLSGALNNRDEEIKKLSVEINQLNDLLSLGQASEAKLRQTNAELAAQLQQTINERNTLLQSRDQLQAQLSGTQKVASAKDLQIAQEEAEIAALNQNIDELRKQLSAIAAALNLSESQVKLQQAQIADLGTKLNLALAKKVEELSNFRSEFFGRLKEIIGNRPDIRVVGDRFVFQSEVLFKPGSADLSPDAKQRLQPVVAALRDIEGKIPSTINWILEVDGHTDHTPIKSPIFQSNWELSTARAVSVVKFLISQGIPPAHLAAAGFGEWQPLDPANTPDAYRKNRRIELKLTQD
jgi:chemotaxis protein MotB